MPSSYTSNLRLVLPVTGELSGTWGDTVNDGLTELVDSAISGTAAITMTAANYTLSTANGATDEARQMVLSLAGTPGASYQVIVPALSKLYLVNNATGFAQTVKTSGGSGISVPTSSVAFLYCDGTNVVTALTALGTPAQGVLTNCTGLPAAGVTGTALVSAAIGTTVQAYDADLTTWAGITPGANVGTALAVAVGSAGAVVTNGGVLGTPSSGTLTNCTGLPVAGGGTGRATGTTAYSLVATGTTATGAQQTLASGATTEVLVGGGASALPVWTTASGSGAPVRATSPSLVTPVLGTPSSGNLSSCTDAVAYGIKSATTTVSVSAATAPSTGQVLMATSTTNATWQTPAAGAGTVTSVSVVSANGLAGTVATATTTPAITLTTSITGVLKGNGTALSAATAGTDYVVPGGALGTPSSGTLTNCTGLPPAGVTGTAAVLGANTFTADQALGDNDITGVKTVGFTAEFDNGNSSTADTITLANGQKQKSTLTGNATLTISTTGATVGAYQLRLIQDGTGGRTVTWSGLTATRWLGATSAPAINAAIAGETIITMFFDGTNITQSASKVGAV